jgi:hypothetical protein
LEEEEEEEEVEEEEEEEGKGMWTVSLTKTLFVSILLHRREGM